LWSFDGDGDGEDNRVALRDDLLLLVFENGPELKGYWVSVVSDLRGLLRGLAGFCVCEGGEVSSSEHWRRWCWMSVGRRGTAPTGENLVVEGLVKENGKIKFGDMMGVASGVEGLGGDWGVGSSYNP
jgi:hypothetical protein